MNDTITALSLTRAARVGADLIDYWDGLPTPGSIRAHIDWDTERGHHEQVEFMFYNSEGGFEALREWAIGLQAVTPDRGSWGIGADLADFITREDGREFVEAEAERAGVVIRLVSNRRMEEPAEVPNERLHQ